MARRHGRFIRPPSRTKMWIGAGVASANVAASSAVLFGSLNAAALLLRPFTILRTHLQVMFTSDQQALGENPFGAFGIIVVSDSAVAAGVASVPTPISEPTADFFVYQGLQSQFIIGDATGFMEHIGDSVGYTIDSKAMRKVGHDDEVAMIFELRSAVGALVGVEGRMLVALH